MKGIQKVQIRKNLNFFLECDEIDPIHLFLFSNGKNYFHMTTCWMLANPGDVGKANQLKSSWIIKSFGCEYITNEDFPFN